MSATLADADVAGLLAPRTGVVAERADRAPVVGEGIDRHPVVGDGVDRHPEATGHVFVQADGPLARYRRTVELSPDPAGGVRVTQTVDLTVGLPYVSWVFAPLLRHHLGRIGVPAPRPWWAPPARLSHRAAVTLAALCAFSALEGYLGDLLPTVMTYAGREFGVGSAGQGVALGVVQANAVLALMLLGRADRRGRRAIVIGCTAAAGVVTAAAAASPSLAVLTAAQVIAASLVTAADVLLGVLAVEEMPPGSRAWAVALVTMSFGLGGGVVLAVLPVADAGATAWRWLFAVGALTVPAAIVVGRHLPEGSGWIAGPAGAAGRRGPLGPTARRRLLLLGVGALLFALFDAPSGQLQNQYLRTERHWSATRIALAEQVTGTVGGLGSLVGGRLADTHGRRPVAAVALAAGTATTLAEYLTRGPSLYVLMAAASLCAYAVVPALGVYGAELFAGGWRGRTGGVLTVLGAAGGLIGLAATGLLSGAIGSIGPALAVLAVAPVALIVLVLRAYPETAGRRLEELAPEPVPDPPPVPQGPPSPAPPSPAPPPPAPPPSPAR